MSSRRPVRGLIRRHYVSSLPSTDGLKLTGFRLSGQPERRLRWRNVKRAIVGPTAKQTSAY
jgi:hypothetical protein